MNANPFSVKYGVGAIALFLPLLTLYSCTGRSPESTASTSSSPSSQTQPSHYSQYIQRSVNRPS
ncbi:MAG: hypothetical protein VKL39_12670, partial [Leptolyngbyaceae bacterium]|nr:hypothetical protein [Leptolyngbyaceae bacterium]